MVGGYSFDDSKFNRATQAYRQVGSSFKVYVYADALEQGMSPFDTVVDAPIDSGERRAAITRRTITTKNLKERSRCGGRWMVPATFRR